MKEVSKMYFKRALSNQNDWTDDFENIFNYALSPKEKLSAKALATQLDQFASTFRILPEEQEGQTQESQKSESEKTSMRNLAEQVIKSLEQTPNCLKTPWLAFWSVYQPEKAINPKKSNRKFGQTSKRKIKPKKENIAKSAEKETVSSNQLQKPIAQEQREVPELPKPDGFNLFTSEALLANNDVPQAAKPMEADVEEIK